MQASWTKFCKYYSHFPKVNLSVDISRMNFADDFFEKMQSKIDFAFSEMKKLENGELANPDEKRMVGHYWLRDASLAPNSEIKSQISNSIAEIKQFAKSVHSGQIKPEQAEKFTNALIIGIGGSALGPQLVYDALWSPSDKMKLSFFDNTDPDGIQKVIAQIGSELKSTLCLVISKSGGTVETRNGQLEAKNAFASLGLNFNRHAVAITCANSKLDNQAIEENWIKSLHMWDWVGGRTSLFSAVGLVPAILQGIEIDEFLQGAKEMDEETRTLSTLKNPAMILALMWHSAGCGQGKKGMVILPYKDRLCLFSKYLQQLVMESIGKEKNLQGETVNQGIAVYGNKGSTDQHAYVQQLREGLNNFFATFIEVLKDFTPQTQNSKNSIEVEPKITSGDYLNGFFQGTRLALFENNRESITLTIPELNTKSLGGLIALYERAVGFYASLVGVNAYHQPGVEAGKKAATRVVALQIKVVNYLETSKQSQTALEISTAIEASTETETVYKILEHLAANNKVTRSTDCHPQTARYLIA
jgi:glucose-6-phosphate isomerase